jgi:hypothetical protein
MLRLTLAGSLLGMAALAAPNPSVTFNRKDGQCDLYVTLLMTHYTSVLSQKYVS